jgi:hypothetical protein
MTNHVKQYIDYSEFLNASATIDKFQRIHNILRKDYLVLLDLIEIYKSNKIEFDSLYRAGLRSIFSLIEADIYCLNYLDKYDDYSDKDHFEKKMKSTFKQVCETWNKEQIGKKYFETKYCDLKTLRQKRDELIHPKDTEHLHEANEGEFEKLKKVFKDYDSFINDLMNDFYIGFEFKTL